MNGMIREINTAGNSGSVGSLLAFRFGDPDQPTCVARFECVKDKFALITYARLMLDKLAAECLDTKQSS